jgi:hypothetical protein
MALTTVPVTGQINGPAGSNFAAEFIRPVWPVSAADNTIESARVIYADVAEDGSFTVNLPATDQPGYVPTGWTYRVILTCGNRRIVGSLSVPYNSGGFDLADRINLDDPPEPGDTYVTLGMRGAANGVAALDGTGKVPAAQLPASAGGDPAWSEITGKPSTFPPEAHTHPSADVVGLDAVIVGIGSDVGELDTRVTALEDAPGGGGTTMQVRRAIVTSGSLTAQNTGGGWAVITGGPTLTIPAVAGDYISAEIMGVLIQPNSGTFYELAALNAGTPVRYGSTGTGTPAVEGDPAMYPDAAFQGRGGPVLDFVAQAGDINAGNVTIGIAVNSTASGSRTLYASAAFPLRWRVINHGQADMA